MSTIIDGAVARGEIGGRTVQIAATGAAECAHYPRPVPRDGQVLIRTERSAISPGTEMTFLGREATNVHLHKRWDEALRLLVPGTPSVDYPVVFGYRAAGTVVESRNSLLPEGTRLYGNWRHTEYLLGGSDVTGQILPDALTWDDGVDVGQMGPICINAVAFGEGAHNGHPSVVFGAGPIGLITAQIVRASGATVTYVVDRVASRLSIAESLGFVPIDASGDADIACQLKSRHGSEAIPVAFECTGSAAALHQATRVVQRRGVVVAAGFYQGGASDLILGDEFHHNGIQLICGQIGNVHPAWTRPLLRQRTIEMALGGSLVLGGLPRRTMSVERIDAAFEALQHPDEHLQIALSYG